MSYWCTQLPTPKKMWISSAQLAYLASQLHIVFSWSCCHWKTLSAGSRMLIYSMATSASSGRSCFTVTVVLCRGPHVSILAHQAYQAFASQMACTCMTNLMYSGHTVCMQQPFVLSFWVSGSLVQLSPQLASLPSGNPWHTGRRFSLHHLFPTLLFLPCPPAFS